jgi:predicted HD phosphohydrolase
LHDISDDLAPDNHGQFAASIIKPYVSRPVIWTVNMHGLFQQAYCARHLGQDSCDSDRYHDHPYFEHRVNFCAEWDQPTFDPHYKTPSLEHFSLWWRRFLLVRLLITVSCSATATTRL